MEDKKNSRILKVLLAIFIVLTIVFGGFIVYDKIIMSDEIIDIDNLGQEKDDDNITIVTKRYDDLSCKNFETSLNGIDIKIASDEDEVCTSTMYVNNENIDIKENIVSIQILDKIILIETSNTSSKNFKIYNVLKGDFEDVLLPEDQYVSFGYNNNVISLNYKYSMQSSSPSSYYDKMFLEELSCEQLESVKDRGYVFVEWTYEMEYYGNGKISYMKVAEKTELKDSEIYQELRNNCK